MKKTLMLTVVLAVCLLWGNLVFAADGVTPTIYNKTMTSASTEYSQVLGPNIKKITLQCQSANDAFIAFSTGYVATPTAPYFTVKSGTVLTFDNLDTNLETTTLYCGCAGSGKILEIIVWR